MNEKIIIECFGCKRTQTLRKSKLIKSDFYTCSLGSCKMNPDAIFPKQKEGYIRIFELNAAGSFSGVIDRIPTEEEKKSLNKAQELKYLGEIYNKEKIQKPQFN